MFNVVQQVTHICYLGQDAVLKTRMQKKYRHPELDEALTSKRIIAECRAVAKLRKNGIYVPLIYLADIKNRHIVYEFIKGETVHSTLAHSKGANNASVLMKVGTIVAKMHDVNIVHGDLTTHNMLRTDGGDICLIDFGLSFVSTLAEVCAYIYRHMRAQDKAVDLYVLERCCTTSEVGASMCLRWGIHNAAVRRDNSCLQDPEQACSCNTREARRGPHARS